MACILAKQNRCRCGSVMLAPALFNQLHMPQKIALTSSAETLRNLFQIPSKPTWINEWYFFLMFLRLIIRRHPRIIFCALFAYLDFRCNYEFNKRLRWYLMIDIFVHPVSQEGSLFHDGYEMDTFQSLVIAYFVCRLNKATLPEGCWPRERNFQSSFWTARNRYAGHEDSLYASRQREFHHDGETRRRSAQVSKFVCGWA